MPRSFAAFRPAVVTVFAATLWLAPTPTGAAPGHPGHWSPAQDWSNVALHMALLPGSDSTHHSKLLWWDGSHVDGTVVGGLWRWKENVATD